MKIDTDAQIWSQTFESEFWYWDSVSMVLKSGSNSCPWWQNTQTNEQTKNKKLPLL